MPLPNPTPVSVPAKEFPHLWISNISIQAPAVNYGRLVIETLPYNGTTYEIGSPKDSVALRTDRLWDAVQEVPEVAQAMGAIFAAIEPLRVWIASKEVKKPIENNPPTP